MFNRNSGPFRERQGFLLTLGLLLLVLAFLFRSSFVPQSVLFSNDAPLGMLVTQADHALQNLTGFWQHLNWIGYEQPSALPTVGFGLFLALGPILYSKFAVPMALLLLGLSAWLFFRQLRFHPIVCMLGALAVALNMNAFSNACWGLPGWVLARTMVFLALAALVSPSIRRTWVKFVLAGFAVGMGVMDGFDTGAIFSLYVAAFALVWVWVHERPLSRASVARGVGGVMLMAVCAALIAAQAVVTLIGTQIAGVAQMEMTQQDRQQRWDFATQWSLPKVEALRVVIPGLFGYRMNVGDGSDYWGTVGQQPGWPEHRQGPVRHSGSGEYAGLLVLLLAVWAVAQSLRKKRSPFSDMEKRMVWFWSAVALLSLLFAFGRHAPFYQFLYALPYFSTIRNPIKFMHPCHVALGILFAYGLQVLWREYLEKARARFADSLGDQLKGWWQSATGFERGWIFATGAVFGAGLFAWVLYAAMREPLERHLQTVGFDQAGAAAVSAFSVGELGLFLLFLLLSVALLTLILSGWLGRERARWAGLALGLFLVVDLGRANRHWIVHYDYQERYASNPVLDILRDQPEPQRVAARLGPMVQSYLNNEHAPFWPHLCHEWLEHHFQFYRIPSLDIIQMPRVPDLDRSFMNAFVPRAGDRYDLVGRLWELTNTRFILGMTAFGDLLNEQLDPAQGRFRIHTRFVVEARHPGGHPVGLQELTARPDPNGPFALFEFTGALPRAMFHPHWKVVDDDSTVLEELTRREFDPHRTVLVQGALPDAPLAENTQTAPPETRITRYTPKRVEVQVNTETPGVLLLNDRFHPDYRVWVNGQPRELLRCNYIMRGVHLEPGEHVVEFRFQPPTRAFYVTLVALLAALGLCGWVIVAAAMGHAQQRSDTGQGESGRRQRRVLA